MYIIMSFRIVIYSRDIFIIIIVRMIFVFLIVLLVGVKMDDIIVIGCWKEC